MNHNEIAGMLDRLEINGIKLWQEDGKLKYSAPQGALTAEIRAVLKQEKADIINFLKKDAEAVVVAHDEENRYKPFPLTDIQSAYLIGRNEAFALSGVACHIYMEFHYDELEPQKAEDIWNAMIKRHDSLRTCFCADGTQVVLESVPPLRINYADVSEGGQSAKSERIESVRAELGHCIHAADNPPLMALAITKTDCDAILHLSMDFIMVDWTSIHLLLAEFEGMYFYGDSILPEFEISFRDYLTAEALLKEKSGFYKDKKYWMDKIDTLPAAPDIAVKHSSDSKQFKRLYLNLDPERWNSLKGFAAKFGLTPSSVVLASYAQVLDWWSNTDKFSLNLTVLNRFPLHEQVNSLIGDFTSVSLLECDFTDSVSFADSARKLNARLFDDLDHRLYSGVMVMREIAKRKGRESALMPFVYTSSIGVIQENPERPMVGRFDGEGISQTPQVYLDCQAMDGSFGLQVNWDYRDGIFDENVVEDMFAAFKALLEKLCESEEIWSTDIAPILPQYQLDIVAEVNKTDTELPKGLLHGRILDSIKRTPEKLAAADENKSLTYGELGLLASAVKSQLEGAGCSKGDTVGIVMPKSVYQIISAVGILDAQCVYVPIDVHQAPLRREKILTQCGISVIVTLSAYKEMFDGASYKLILADELVPASSVSLTAEGDTDALAYIIYTSGSTGTPKGVAIRHSAAVNTIEDINSRFDVTSDDCILGLSQLNFDLSVYDIFGVLGAGGTLVYPSAAKYADPSHWMELIKQYKITLWNSVPAFMQMLTDYIESSSEKTLPHMRLIMMSGDWIPVTLPERIWALNPDVLTVSLGGATEASIWSIYHICREVKRDWNSIPYGKPLANQGYHVLDSKLRERPFWVQGDLYITGVGLADCYYKEDQLTADAFLTVNGVRMYKTGDTGRWMANGEIEFMGRNDGQLKIHGHRIELGEIDSCIVQAGAIQCCTLAIGSPTGEKILVSFYCADAEADVSAMKEKLKDSLPIYMIPSIIKYKESLPLTANGKVDRKQLSAEAEELLKEQLSEHVEDEPLTPLEQEVFDICAELLNITSIGKNDDLYSKGADSLIIGKAAGIIREKLLPSASFDNILAQLLRGPSIREIAEFIDAHRSGANSVKSSDSDKQSESFAALKAAPADLDKIAVLLWDENGSDALMQPIADKCSADFGIAQILPCNLDKLKEQSAEDALQTVTDSCIEAIRPYADKEITIFAHGSSSWFAIELAGKLTAAEYPLNKLMLIDALPSDDDAADDYKHLAAEVSAIEPGLYMGDLALFYTDGANSTEEYWSSACLGDFDAQHISGDHTSCLSEQADVIVSASK